MVFIDLEKANNSIPRYDTHILQNRKHICQTKSVHLAVVFYLVSEHHMN